MDLHFSKEQALQKARYYCTYQERCHSEVKEKLYSLGLYKKDVEELLSNLIEDNYLNEERFAIQFAGGRFRIKQWGKVKIKYELKQKLVSDFCIKKALASINENDYQKTIQKLFSAKLKTVPIPVILSETKLEPSSLILIRTSLTIWPVSSVSPAVAAIYSPLRK